MSYAIEVGEPVTDALRRIAHEQLTKAVNEIDDEELDRHESVHQARKRGKKVRALLRLFRDSIGDTYKRENRAVRDAARLISDARDAQAHVEALDELEDTFGDALDSALLADLRGVLVERREEIAAKDVVEPLLARVRARLLAVRERAAGWEADDDDFAALAGGLRRTYKRACKRQRKAAKRDSFEAHHEWRKRVKYHRYHVRLLQPIWDDPLDARRSELHDLSDLLGDDNDLCELRDTLHDLPNAPVDRRAMQALDGVIAQRSRELRDRAHALGTKLLVDEPDELVARFETWWDAAHA